MAKIEKILFVDDDNVCSFLNVNLVEELGIAKEVRALNNAAEALAYIQQEYCSSTSACPPDSPDLIFLDIRMPGMDGFELLQELDKIKELDRSRFLIIMLSATLSPADQEKAYRQRTQLFSCLTKPLAKEDIQQILTGVPAELQILPCPTGSSGNFGS